MSETTITREVLHKALQEPTVRELLDAIGRREAILTKPCHPEIPERLLAARVEAVLALHERQRMMTVGCVRCNECGQEWPCATMLALNGEEV
jgi:hypothetical protein